MMPFFAFFLTPIGKWAAIAAVVAAALGGIYIKGRSDGKAKYQAKLTRQLESAIKKGNAAEAEALKKFDADKEADDGFARPD